MLDQYAEYEQLVSQGQPAGGAAQAEEGGGEGGLGHSVGAEDGQGAVKFNG